MTNENFKDWPEDWDKYKSYVEDWDNSFVEETWEKVVGILKQHQFTMDVSFSALRYPSGYWIRFTHPQHYPALLCNNNGRIIIQFDWNNLTWGQQPAYEFTISKPNERKGKTGKSIHIMQCAYVNPLSWYGDEEFWQLFSLCVEKGANCPELQNRPRGYNSRNKNPKNVSQIDLLRWFD